MKNIYTLTATDCSNAKDSIIFSNLYSNKKAALGSFDTLKKHLLDKFKLDDKNTQRWIFESGVHQTEILSGRYNITLVKNSVSKSISSFNYSI